MRDREGVACAGQRAAHVRGAASAAWNETRTLGAHAAGLARCATHDHMIVLGSLMPAVRNHMPQALACIPRAKCSEKAVASPISSRALPLNAIKCKKTRPWVKLKRVWRLWTCTSKLSGHFRFLPFISSSHSHKALKSRQTHALTLSLPLPRYDSPYKCPRSHSVASPLLSGDVSNAIKLASLPVSQVNTSHTVSKVVPLDPSQVDTVTSLSSQVDTPFLNDFTPLKLIL